MPIEFPCECGRDLYLRDDLAGKQIRCPDCQRMLTVPAAGRSEPFRDEPPAAAPDYDALNERSEERRPDPPPLPVAPPLPRPRARPSGGGVNVGKLVGGLAMMLAGGVMLGVGGNMCGIRLPVILLIIGLITAIKGLLGSRDDD